jgi:tRNA(His) 5'-end guanylyltransferase
MQRLLSRNWAEVAARMKRYEAEISDKLLRNDKPIIMRLDGTSFSTFTAPYKKPFDDRIHKALVMAAADISEKYQPQTAYVCSDEVSFIFAENTLINKNNAVHGGRPQKITSVASGMLSARFTHHIFKMLFEKDVTLLKAMINNPPYFDCRIAELPSREEAFENIGWRQMDCIRNSIALLARKHYSHDETTSKKSAELIQMLQEKNLEWNEQPNAFRYGTLLKKRKVAKESINPKTNLPIQVMRNQWIPCSLLLADMKTLFAEEWGDEFNKSDSIPNFTEMRKKQL